MLSYTHCNFCNAILSHDLSAEEQGDHFLFCSKDCKQKKEEQWAEKRKQTMKNHHPWDRMSAEEQETTKRTLKTEGPVVWNEATAAAADAQDKLNLEKEASTSPPSSPSIAGGIPARGKLRGESKAGDFLRRQDEGPGKTGKAGRKCGRCGKSGHNARTCSKRLGS